MPIVAKTEKHAIFDLHPCLELDFEFPSSTGGCQEACRFVTALLRGFMDFLPILNKTKIITG